VRRRRRRRRGLAISYEKKVRSSMNWKY